MLKHLEMYIYNKIYPPMWHLRLERQNGFIEYRSTVTNLSCFSHFLYETLNHTIDVILTNFKRFSKTFLSYLYTGFLPELFFSTSGVPQGSNLGPLRL